MTQLFHLQGWFEQNTEGIGTVYLAITDEGLLTTETDTPAGVAFPPRIRNPETFSIKRSATFWPWGDSGDSIAAYGELQIDNYDGAFDFLLQADLRDAPVVFKIVPAKMLAANNTVANGITVATAIIDDIACDTEDVIRITFKDNLARFDAPLTSRYNPPYMDSNAANRMVPLTFGACRNVQGLLIAQEGLDNDGHPVYQLHDVGLTNIAQTRDMGAILDVNADPPQVTPALNRSGFQLEALPQGKLLSDCSSVGTQAIAAGAVDVLNGAGLLTTWPSSGSPPTGWSYGGSGTHVRVGTPQYVQDYCMQMTTTDRFIPTLSEFGDYAYITTPFLQPGAAYRITFAIDQILGAITPQPGGFLVRTNLTVDPTGDVSGPWNGPYLTNPQLGSQNFSFEYRAPNDGTVRTLYMIMVGGGGTQPSWTGTWHGLTVELLGQFEEQPLQGITLANFYNEILFLRAYQDTSVWDATSLTAIDDATGYTFGIHYDSAPNIYRDCLLGPLSSYCAGIQTDADGVIYAFRLLDPKLATPVASFDLTNTVRPIAIKPDRALFLTTIMGGARNWTLSGPSDFVTDYALVPADVRMRYGRTSQYQVTSSITPAGEYSSAIGAPIFDSLIDVPIVNGVADTTNIQTEIDRVVGLYAPKVYNDGTIFNGKRNFVTFTVLFDDVGVLGNQSLGALAAQNLLIGDTVLLTYEHADGSAMFSDTPIFVAGTELFPFGNKLTIMGWY